MISLDITIKEGSMADILIRDIPEDVLIAIDTAARTLGLSRTEYLRRTLAGERRLRTTVTVGDLTKFASTFEDLADSDVMEQAWR